MNDRIPETPPVILPVPEGSARPLWSVMIPVYNCFPYIKEAIESVLIQDRGIDNMQIEVIDDFSTDGDVEALVHEVGKGRVGYYRQERNRGSLRNFETCINRAKGKYVHILHGDDRVAPCYYQTIEDLFISNPEAGAAFTNFTYIDHLGKQVDIVNRKIQEDAGIIKDFLYKIAHRQLVQPPAITVKRSVYEKLGSFYAVHFGEDWEMWTRIASKYPVAYSPQYMASYRVAHGIGISHNSFLTGQNIIDMTRVINIIQEHLPQKQKALYKRIALDYYALFCIRIANGLLLFNKKAAFTQIRGAWQMSRSLGNVFWIIRFYLMHILRYKQIEKKIKNSAFKLYEKNVL
ncbi:glycosyltransferase [Pedobacter sp. P351]|uniref:glycosyltransferase family 2 protein n=1 Tax=Pedobacter superstes TaxID=3133441 RepID=UPI00309EF653